MLRTRFSEMFGLEYPLMSAPMAMHSGGALAGAVSAAWGLGSFGGVHGSGTPEWIRSEVAKVRRHTGRPFAIGFSTGFIPMLEPLFDAALSERPAAIALSLVRRNSRTSRWSRSPNSRSAETK
jgi:nitronate monooxygenase